MLPRRLLKEETGSELIEFAVSAAVLMMMIFGIMDCSRALYSYHFVAGAARDATRYAAVRGASWTGVLCLLSSSFQCAATSSDVTNYVKSITPAGLTTANLAVTTTWPGTTATGVSCNALGIYNSPGCMVNVKVTYTFNFALPFLPKSALTLSSTSKVIITQ